MKAINYYLLVRNFLALAILIVGILTIIHTI